MKNTFLFIIFSCFSVIVFSQETSESSSDVVTTYYFIRHAEKELNNTNDRNPKLSIIGKQRAENWAEILKNVSFDAIYSTDYYRTRETANPIAKYNNIPIIIYELNNFDFATFKESTKGKNILIVGHSNTTPNMVNELIQEKKYKQISENNFSNIYIITIIGTTVSDKLLTIN